MSVQMNDELERFLANARGTAATAKILSLDELRAHRGAEQSDAAWGFAALRGRLVELSARGATATLTAAIEIVAEAQTQGEPVAWFSLGASSFYPPDVADSGIDLAALVVIRAHDAMALARSAERCLRSGAFGLVILDLGSLHAGAELSTQVQGRLVTLAQTHDAAVVCLTDKTEDTASLGSLISLPSSSPSSSSSPSGSMVSSRSLATSLSGATHVSSDELFARARNPSEFEVGVRVLKDKRRGPGFTQTLKRRGPAGLI
jgi:recombination protein RecA